MLRRGKEVSCALGTSDITQSTQTISFVSSSFTQLTAFPHQELCPPLTQSTLWFSVHLLVFGAAKLSRSCQCPAHHCCPQPTAGLCRMFLALLFAVSGGSHDTSASQLRALLPLVLLQLSSQGE